MKILAYACSARPNALWSAAQYDSALPKNRAECDTPLVSKADAELALALKVEAMQWEMAKLRAERRMIVSHATMGGTDGEGMSVNAVSVEITRLRNHLIEDTRARTLIQGEKK